MNILIYNWKDIKNPLVGGAEIITFEYARRLAAEGHKVTWFCRAFAGCEPQERIDGVTVIRRGGYLSTYFQGYKYYRSLKKKPDIVVDMLNTIAWQTPLYAAKQSAVVQYVNQLAKEVWSYEMKPPLSWIGRILEPLELLPYHRVPVVTYAPSTAQDLIDWGYEPQKIELFQLGLDHKRYTPGTKVDYPLFLHVSRMVRMKRPDLTVRAFAEVLKQHPAAKLALVGSGPYKEDINVLVAELGLSDNVLMPDKDILFFENVKGDRKIELMQEAWCVVHPSVKEGWAMVITEAAACGTPSIATSVTGQVDSVKDGESGILICKDPSVKELATAMLKVIEDKKLRDKISAGAIEWAAQLNWDKSYELFKSAITRATGVKLVEEKMDKDLPKISVVTPVFNAAKVLKEFFAGIEQTNYPKNKIEIIMPDGGSSDKTRELAEKYGAKIIENPLKTAEAGKAEGVKYVLAELKKKQADASNHLICLLDSDNIIVTPDFFTRMVEPFAADQEIIGTEPWEYIRRDQDAYITRYTAMLGMSDPVCHFLGNYDRLDTLTGRWTDLPIKTTDHLTYFDWEVDAKVLPTIGANGTIFRASFFDAVQIKDFMFDIDLLYEYTLKHQAKFAKVKVGVVHLFSGTVKTFIRKQKRRIKDYGYFQAMGLRSYPWDTLNKKGLIIFVLSCVTIIPLLWQAIKGFYRKPDMAWFFHPIACWITLWIYGTGRILGKFQKPALADRTNWSQG